MNSVWIAGLQRHKTSVLPWESIRRLPKGDQMLKGASLPLHQLVWVRQVIWFMTWGMRWHHWRIYYCKWILLPKCPSTLHDMVDHHPNDLYHLSISKVTQYMRIRCAMVYKLEWLKGKEEVTSPHLPMHGLVLLIADMLEDGLEEWIREAVVLASREAILFFRQWSLKEGLPLGDARDVGFCLAGPVNWAGIEAQVETMVSTVQEGKQAIADAIMEKRTKDWGPGCPRGTTKTNQTLQQHTISKSGCKAWRKMLPNWRWEMVMWVIVGLSGGILVLNMQIEAEASVEDKVPHNYQKTLLVDLPLQEGRVPIEEVTGVPISQPWWEGLEKVTKQEGQEVVWGEGQSAGLHGWKDQRCCDLPFVVVGCGYFPQFGVGWPTLAAIHLLVITGVPQRPCQGFR